MHAGLVGVLPTQRPQKRIVSRTKTLQLRSAARDSGGGSRRLLLSLRSHADRFLTELTLEDAGETTLLLQSVEGSSQQAWPDSPPLQEVVAQEIDGREVLTGVGSAGKGHWSVVVQVLNDELGFEFDLACRAREPAEWIGSTYKVVAQGGMKIRCVGEQTSCHVESDGNTLRCRPLANEQIQVPATLRWKYRLMLD